LNNYEKSIEEDEKTRKKIEKQERFYKEKRKERIKSITDFGKFFIKDNTFHKALLFVALAVLVLSVGMILLGLPDGGQPGVVVPNKQPEPTGVIVDNSEQPAENIINSIGMEFVLIPAGEFDMGSPSDEEGRYDDEGPVHRVMISNPFYLGAYEVTQKQWREIMENNPSAFKDNKLPVECVSWYDVQEFINKLNEKEMTTKYRLPSEAEWEYAARAGTTTRYFFGDSESKLGVYAWYYENSGDTTHPVGEKKPNPWGLYDIHGNVYEWVQDKWHNNYDGAPADGSPWENGNEDKDDTNRVIRGSGYCQYTAYCRSAYRNNEKPVLQFNNIGFRLLQEV
jgi:formylglycine-generating enzyme required for sulfatase activity